MRIRSIAAVLSAAGLGIWSAAGGAEPPKSPLPPDEGLRSIRVPAGLKVELVASEPAVTSPVAMAFDENGVLYVVEMSDYPLGPQKGRVKRLESTKGDGRFDKVTVFADNLNYPNGVMPYKGGVFVTSAPDLLYLKDTKGTGTADERRVVFTGFAESNPQHRTNTPLMGLDGWVYVADGDSTNGIRRPDKPDLPAFPLRGSDFRFHPETLAIELVSGRSQYAHSFDDWGDRYICDNSRHIRRPVLPAQYLKRNPNLAVAAVVEDISDHGPAGRVFPSSHIEARFNDQSAAGHFTSACGIHIYRGDALPAAYRGQAFVCEPVHNLVHLDLLGPGATVAGTAKRATADTEFLAGTDNWSRPVSLAEGPDGALYVADMYRAVIEHPQWIPLDVQKRIDLRAGADRGRIYRVVPEGGAKWVQPKLGAATDAELVAALRSPNGWVRDTAHRLLLERKANTAGDPLWQALRDANEHPRAALHALYVLDVLNILDDASVQAALYADEPGLRRAGLALAEPFLANAEPVRTAVLAAADDKDPRVRFQAAFTLGGLPGDKAVAALAKIVVRDGGDPWVQTAVLSSVPDRGAALLAQIVGNHVAWLSRGDGVTGFARRLSAMVGARGDKAEIAELLRIVAASSPSPRMGEGRGGGASPTPWRVAALTGLGGSLRGAGFSDVLKSADVLTIVSAWLPPLLEAAADPSHDLAARLDALALLALLPAPDAAAKLTPLLAAAEPQQIQSAAVRALAALPGAGTADLLLIDWAGRSPSVRREVVAALLATPERAGKLLDAMEKGAVKVFDIETARREQMLAYRDESIRARAKRLLEAARPTNRVKIVDEWSAKVLPLAGDAVRGQTVYAKNCMICHRLHGQGFPVGPDLAGMAGRTREALLVDILDPNRAVAPEFLEYVIATTDGRFFNGMIAAETPAGITLRQAEQKETVVLRRDIDKIRTTGLSMMPEGLEKNLTAQDLADLLELLRRGKAK